MNKNALNVGISAKRMDGEMGDKVIAAKHVVMCFRTNGENGLQMSFGMNIVTNEGHIIFSPKAQNGA